jgi:hypothetical protein
MLLEQDPVNETAVEQQLKALLNELRAQQATIISVQRQLRGLSSSNFCSMTLRIASSTNLLIVDGHQNRDLRRQDRG